MDGINGKECIDFTDVIEIAAQKNPDKVMMIDTVKGQEICKYTYFQANEKAKKIANYLGEMGIHNERILLMLQNNSEMIIYMLACFYSGNEVVIENNILSDDSRLATIISSKIKKSQVSVIVASSVANEKLIDQIYENVEDTEMVCIYTNDITLTSSDIQKLDKSRTKLACIQFTSGMSKQPKGVCLNHGNLIHEAEKIRLRCPNKINNNMVSSLPLSHNLGLLTALSMFLMESTVIFVDVREVLVNPLVWLSIISKYKATVIGGINLFFISAFRNVSESQLDGLDLSSVNTTFIGGEEVKVDVLRAFVKKFSAVGFSDKSWYPGYGMTENTLLISTSTPYRGLETIKVDEKELRNNNIVQCSEGGKEFTSNGTIIDEEGSEVIIVDPDTLEKKGDMCLGEIWISGETVADGYINDEDEEKARFHQKYKGCEREYLRSGDIGFIKEKRLYITGRINDLIIIDGNNFYAQEFDIFIGKEIANVPIGNIVSFAEKDENDNEKLTIVMGYPEGKCPDNEISEKIASEIKNKIFSDYNVAINRIVFTDEKYIIKTSIGKVKRNQIKNNLANGAIQVNYVRKG